MRPRDPRLLRHAHATVAYLAGCAFTGTATGALLVVQAGLLADVIGRVFVGGADLEDVRWSLAALALAVLARALLAWLQDVVAHAAASRVKSTLRRRLLAHVVALGPAWLAGRRNSDLVTLAVRGVDGLDAYFARYLPQLVLAVTVPAMVVARLLGADLLSALTVAVTLPLVPVFMALVGLATQRRADRRWRALAVLAHHFADVVAGLPTLQVFGRARAQAEGVGRVTEAYRAESLGALRMAFLSALVLELLTTLSVALVAVGVGLRVVEGRFDLATGLLVLVLAPEAYAPLRRVGANFHASVDGLAAADRLFQVLETPLPARVTGADRDIPDLSRSVVRVDGVTVCLDRSRPPALVAATLELRPGELVALAGPSGSGKSTLLSVLLAFVAPDGGRVRVGDRDLADLDPDAWRRRVGWVPQRPYLVAGTVADNVRLGAPDASDADVADALLAAAADGLDPDTAVGDGGGRLSAGQRRRVAIARALVRRPSLLLLDEPTAGLDADAELAVLHTLCECGTTTLVVAHRAAVLAAVDRMVRLVAPDPRTPGRQVVAPRRVTPVGPRPVSPSGGGVR